MEEVCGILEELVSKGVIINYAIGGATAAGFHGEPLATRDIDVFAFIPHQKNQLIVSLESIYLALAEMGFREFDEEGILIFGYPVQFLSASEGLETEAVESSMMITWQEKRMRVMRAEYLAAIAIQVGRPKDRARLVYLYELEIFDRGLFLDILKRYQLEDRWTKWSNALDL